MKAATVEAKLLRHVELVLQHQLGASRAAWEARLQLLEAAAAEISGLNLPAYQRTFEIGPRFSPGKFEDAGRAVADAIFRSGISAPLAISSLAREPLVESARRSTGAYYTDFRLASHLASMLRGSIQTGVKAVDPACGAGVLLLALSSAAIEAGISPAAWLAESVFAADMSEAALRSAQVGFLALTDDVGALRQMRSHWLCHDSLMSGPEAWRSYAADGFDIVLANPPWEKVKLSRHEFLRASGVDRDYGTEYEAHDGHAYEEHRERVASYGEELARRYSALTGEPDLYVAFTELLIALAKPAGEVGVIVPAGLIRSQGTARLREQVMQACGHVQLEVFENRARFFEIDTRFKFLVARLRRASSEPADAIELSHAQGTDIGTSVAPAVRLRSNDLRQFRPDLSVPEVRSDAEWRIYKTIATNGEDWSRPESAWHPKFVREVDMTRDRSIFERHPVKGSVPLIEGRMVHQHRFGVKSYISGSGRSAVWSANPLGMSRLDPQFWVRLDHLPAPVRARIAEDRAGFCDITGQTNERSMLASYVPAGVACGNKVPTVLFPRDRRSARLWLWLAIVNSLPFDWALRRVVTTTVNYFLLLSIPLPPIEPDSEAGRRLVHIAQALHAADAGGPLSADQLQIAAYRAEADLLVLKAYGLSAGDLQIILDDFPLLDRAQPALPGEGRSTVTRDFLLSLATEGVSTATPWRERLERALASGAIPYLPSHLSGAAEDESQRAYG